MHCLIVIWNGDFLIGESGAHRSNCLRNLIEGTYQNIGQTDCNCHHTADTGKQNHHGFAVQNRTGDGNIVR